MNSIVPYNPQQVQQPQEQFSLKEKILYTLGTIVVVGGTFLLGRKLVLRGIANREGTKSLDEGSTATYAKQIKMAFENDGWPGTDTDKLRSVLREIPSREEFDNVAKSYKKQFNSELAIDMSKELQSTEYSEMLSIIASKPKKKGKTITNQKQYEEWAKRLKAAFDKTYGFLPGTDEKAIKAVFTEIPSQAVFVAVGKAYWKLYNSDMTQDLKSELELWEYGDYMKIITSKPKV